MSENFELSELIDNCLAKNKNKIINILNENNYSTEDCIIILRTFLSKAKRVLNLAIQYEQNKNISKTIDTANHQYFGKIRISLKFNLVNGSLKK